MFLAGAGMNEKDMSIGFGGNNMKYKTIITALTHYHEKLQQTCNALRNLDVLLARPIMER